MIVTALTVYQRDLPLTHPYRLSGGRLLVETLDSTFVRLDTDSGLTGWGEACPWGSTYLPAFGRGIRAGLEELAPAVLGQDPRQLETVERALDLALPGHPYIKSALDIACWDLLGQTSGLPLHTLLGGAAVDAVPIASSISTDTPESMLAEIESYRARGYRVHSAKVGSGIAADIARVRHLAANCQDDELIFYDVNRAWRPHEAIAVMNAVADLPVFFEQPCESHAENLQVRRQTSRPISLDEGIKSYDDLLRAQQDGVAEIVNIKIGRVGGLTKARRLRDLAMATGMGLLIMETGGTVLADTVAAHLARSIPGRVCLGTWACQDMLTVDPAPGRGARNRNGQLAAPDLPGLGVAPDADWLGDPVAVYR